MPVLPVTLNDLGVNFDHGRDRRLGDAQLERSDSTPQLVLTHVSIDQGFHQVGE